jgi:hypothetical protein
LQGSLCNLQSVLCTYGLSNLRVHIVVDDSEVVR